MKKTFRFFKSRDSFDRFYMQFKKPIHQYVLRKTSDVQLAEDLTQEVFIKAYRFQNQYDEQQSLPTWIWTIARNTVTDLFRKKQIKILNSTSSDIEELPSNIQNAESLLMKKDIRRLILKLARPLTRLQKRVLWLKIIRQLSYQEISKKLGLSLSAVKNLAFRAKFALNQNVPEFYSNCS